MKTHTLLALFGLATGFVLPVFGQQKDTVDFKIERQIRELAANYDTAINRHDPAAVAALYAQDAVRVTALNNGTFRGRQAIENAYAQYDFGHWQVSNYFTKVNRINAVGNEVRSTGTWSSVFDRLGGNQRRHAAGYCSWVIVRDGDTWKIRRDSASGGASPFSTNYQ